MARKIANYTVTDEGRDKGKLFVITEMSSSAGEWWATRILMALLGANVDVPDNFSDMSIAMLAQLGMRSLGALKPEVLKPLLDEMFTCIQIVPDTSKKNVIIDIHETHIEEISTRLKLRMEFWELHMGFLDAVLPSLGVSADKPGVGSKPTKTFRKS